MMLTEGKKPFFFCIFSIFFKNFLIKIAFNQIHYYHLSIKNYLYTIFLLLFF